LFQSSWGTALAHGISQGIISQLRGGSFKSGFIGAIVGGIGGSAAGRMMGGIQGISAGAVMARTVVSAVFGGLAARATGGSFEDGAMAAAFRHLFNEEAGRIFTFKTRVGSVLQLSVDAPKQVASFGMSLSPGYREWNLSDGTNYEAGDVSVDFRLFDEGAKLGWERKNTINWSPAKPIVHDQFSMTMGFIVGGTLEVDTHNLAVQIDNTYDYYSTETSRGIYEWLSPYGGLK
jgi:hypothetical protein